MQDVKRAWAFVYNEGNKYIGGRRSQCSPFVTKLESDRTGRTAKFLANITPQLSCLISISIAIIFEIEIATKVFDIRYHLLTL